MKPTSFVLPASFHPGEFLTSPALHRRWDDARYFIGLILTKLARRDVDELGVVRLRAEHLKNIMYQATYADVIDALRQGGAVERFSYQVGERSFGFRLAARFVSDKHVRVPATDSRLIGRLTAFHEQQEAERLSRMQPVHLALAEQQHRLRIHGHEARRTLENLPATCNPFDVQGILVRDIENHEFRCNVGRFGRLSNNISSLKRELRESLHVDGEPLGFVDLSCAQPALLAKVIRDSENSKQGKDGDRQREGEQSKGKYDSSPGYRNGAEWDGWANYLSLVQTGRFYDFMVGQLRDSGIGRDEFKRRFLADVIAKKGRYSSIVEDAFQRLFPSVYGFIRCVNRDGCEHANLIRLLQRAESQIVIETVAADLVTRFPRMFCVTLHDAIYTTDEHLGQVEQAFRRAFDKTGFRMQFKVGRGSSSRGSHVTTDRQSEQPRIDAPPVRL